MTLSGDRLLDHWPAMVRVCQRTLGSREDAEDCAAAALLGVVQRGGLKDVENNEAWMVAVAKRRAADVLRARVREQRRTARLAAEHDTDVADVAELIVERAEARWLKETADSAVPERTRQLVHALSDGMSISEAAEHLGMTKRAAESHLHRARIALRAVWAATLSIIGWAFGGLRKAAPAGPQVAVAAVAVVTLAVTGPAPVPERASPLDRAVASPAVPATVAESRPARPSAAPAEATPARTDAVPTGAGPVPAGTPASPTTRVGTPTTGVDVSAEERDGPSDPAGIVLHCLAELDLSAAEIGC